MGNGGMSGLKIAFLIATGQGDRANALMQQEHEATMSTGEYGIVANVVETDRLLRKGAKVWLLGGWSGGGFERVTIRGASRSGRQIEKYAPITRFENFRVAWMPEHLRDKATYFLGSRDDMDEWARHMASVADRERAAHPHRREKQCDMGVGCLEAGVCYADAHGEPERCPLNVPQPT